MVRDRQYFSIDCIGCIDHIDWISFGLEGVHLLSALSKCPNM